jgi:hypothetical protein
MALSVHTYLKHAQFKDVCCKVLDITFYDSCYVMRIEWFNQGFTRSWSLNEYECIKITPKSSKDWEIVSAMDGTFLRLAQWTPLANIKLEGS